MKNLLLIAFILIGSLQGVAQEKQSHREKIKSLKTAHITEGLSLTSEEAEKFWPLYNEYEKEKRKLYKKENAEIENLECISEKRADAMLTEYVEIERADYLLQKQFYKDLKEIFPAKKIIQLKKVEDEFNKKLWKEYRKRHSSKSDHS